MKIFLVNNLKQKIILNLKTEKSLLCKFFIFFLRRILKYPPTKSIKINIMTLPAAFFTKSNTALVRLASKVKRVFEDIATNNALHNNSSESISYLVIE